jgi:futalosine hydrolase
MTLLLVVTAVAAERDAILAGLGAYGVNAVDAADATTAAVESTGDRGPDPLPAKGAHVLTVGVGIAAAAARTARWLTEQRRTDRVAYDAVISAGIGGAYAGKGALGDIVVGSRAVAADLGAESPDGYLTLSDLGFGIDAVDADADLFDRVSGSLPAAINGWVLSVHTVTGTAARAAELSHRHPDAVAEAMEGWGVATAAADYGVPFVEIRTVSNVVGPRDRSAWRIDLAMGALTHVGKALATLVG